MQIHIFIIEILFGFFQFCELVSKHRNHDAKTIEINAKPTYVGLALISMVLASIKFTVYKKVLVIPSIRSCGRIHFNE